MQNLPKRNSPDSSTIYELSSPFFFCFANFLCTHSRLYRSWQRYAATLPDFTSEAPTRTHKHSSNVNAGQPNQSCATSLTTIQDHFPVHSFIQGPLPAHPFEKHLVQVEREEGWEADWTASVQKALATMFHHINSASKKKNIDPFDHETDVVSASSKSAASRGGPQMVPSSMITDERSM